MLKKERLKHETFGGCPHVGETFYQQETETDKFS